MISKLRRFPWFFFLLLLGCSSLPILVSDEDMRTAAFQQFAAMKEEMPVSSNSAYNAQVDRVGQRIVDVVRDQIPGAQWEFVVFEDESANAFAMPGGKIGVNTGLLKLVDSDDELAAVVGHEICHVLYKHSHQRVSAEIWRGIGGAAAVVAADQADLSDEQQAAVLTLYGVGSQVGLMLPFSRSHETEADAQGLIVAAKAGYDPRGAVTFWQKMAANSEGQPPEFLSTHPSHGNRIERLNELMPQALEIYEASKR
jgi:predicted Zn-dependent protease